MSSFPFFITRVFVIYTTFGVFSSQVQGNGYPVPGLELRSLCQQRDCCPRERLPLL